MSRLLPLLILLAACKGDEPEDERGPVDQDKDGFTDELDCDDYDDQIHPDAEEECGNTVDEDCDGWAAGCGSATDIAIEDERYGYGRENQGLFGRSAVIWDVDSDGRAEVLSGDTTGWIGVWNGGGGRADENPEILDGALQGLAAVPGETAPVPAVGDADGDGTADLIIGAEGSGGPTLFLISGPLPAPKGSPVVEIVGAYDPRWMGDLTGDGLQELLAADSGGLVVLQGPVDDMVDPTAPWASFGDGSGPLGRNTAVGDVDGDGMAELLVGPGTQGGTTYLFETGPGHRTTDDARASLAGLSQGRLQGEAVLLADLDGDGYDDVILGSPGANTYPFDDALGGVMAFTEQPAGALDGDDATLVLEGLAPDHRDGASLAAADLDGDGAAELLVGSPGYHLPFGSAGAVYLMHGGTIGMLSLADQPIRWVAPAGGDQLGSWVGFGDMDGDGALDAVFGAPAASEYDPNLDRRGALVWTAVPL